MQQADLKLYKSKVISDANGNGGRESVTEIVGALMNNLFPTVLDAARLAGGTRYRKCFFHNINGAGQVAQNTKAWLQTLSASEDHYALAVGTHTDTQGDLSNPKLHAAGTVAVAASAGATQVQVDFEAAADVDLAAADSLWLYGVNGEMFNTVSGAPSWNGNRATINLGSQLNVDYPISSICAMMIETGALQPSFDSWVETSAAGTYNEAGYPLELLNFGTVRDDFTLTITGSLGGGVMAFSVSGLYEGVIGTGRTDQDFSPVNPATATAYLTLRAAGFGGTWAIGDTITSKTYPASKGLWGVHIWPAGADAAESVVELVLYAE